MAIHLGHLGHQIDYSAKKTALNHSTVVYWYGDAANYFHLESHFGRIYQ
jgi:hypothetical protein